MSTRTRLKVIYYVMIALGITWAVTEVAVIGGLRDRVQVLEHRVDVLEQSPQKE